MNFNKSPARPLTLNRRNFLLGSGITAAGLLGFPQKSYSSTITDPNTIANGATDVETPRSCRPQNSLKALIQGNKRFCKAWQKSNHATTPAERAQTMANLWLDNCFLPSSVIDTGQAPWATLLSCADSRVAPEWIFDAAPADLFVIRSAGNTAFDDAIASMEYSVIALKTPLIMVMGHSNCGAVVAARNADPLTPLLEQLITPIRTSLQADQSLAQSIKGNACYASRQLTQRSEVLANATENGSLKIVTSYFDISTGKVSLI